VAWYSSCGAGAVAPSTKAVLSSSSEAVPSSSLDAVLSSPAAQLHFQLSNAEPNDSVAEGGGGGLVGEGKFSCMRPGF